MVVGTMLVGEGGEGWEEGSVVRVHLEGEDMLEGNGA